VGATRALVVLMTVLATLAASRSEAPGDGSLTLEVCDDRVTLRARDVPLTTILERLAAATGIAFTLRGTVAERLSVDVAGVGVDEVLRRLLAHQSTLLVYDKTGVPAAAFVIGPRSGLMSDGEVAARPADAIAQEEVLPLGHATAFKIEMLEEKLHAASGAASPEGIRLLQDLLAEPDQSVRIMALQWLARDHVTVVEAVVSALEGGDDLVQRVALEILLERGVDESRLAEVVVAAGAGGVLAVRRMLTALLLVR
jgi:hypothetical protein